MAATTAGALKALIEAGGLGLAAYRDEAPDGAAPPYVTITEEVALVPNGVDPPYDKTYNHAVNETVQVSLWQHWRTPSTGVVAESYALPRQLANLLDGAGLTASPTHTWGVRLLSSRRLLERDTNLVQTAMTVEVIRDIA